MLVDAAVRDAEELAEMAVPVWARWIRSRGRDEGHRRRARRAGGRRRREIRPGDLVVLDADGVTVVDPARADEVLQASLAREAKEAHKRAQLQAGALSYHLDGLDARV